MAETEELSELCGGFGLRTGLKRCKVIRMTLDEK